MNSKERSPSKIKHHACWDEVDGWLWDIFLFLDGKDHYTKYIYGIGRGGLIPAVFLSHHLNLKMIWPEEEDEWNSNDPELLIVDDVIDTGNTIKYFNPGNVVTLIRKPWSPEILFAAKETDKWVKFPWENK